MSLIPSGRETIMKKIDNPKFQAVHKVLGCTWVYIHDTWTGSERGIETFSFYDGADTYRRMCPHCLAKQVWSFPKSVWIPDNSNAIWPLALTRRVRYFAGSLERGEE